MLDAARCGARYLGDSSHLVRDFVFSQLNPDGGFKARDGRSDLYYTVFGLETLLALETPALPKEVSGYLRQFGCGEGLDFIHLTCLGRAWAALAERGLGWRPIFALKLRKQILVGLENRRSLDGGYCPDGHGRFGTAYGAFFAVGACQDLGVELPRPERLLESLERLETPDGAWANEPGLPVGSTPATAAVVSVRQVLKRPAGSTAGEWLLARHCLHGGFRANPSAPLPDLLSTATALHALATLGHRCVGIRESCLDFIDSLWTSRGGFYGHWNDGTLDCEYTFYALLALGHLAGGV